MKFKNIPIKINKISEKGGYEFNFNQDFLSGFHNCIFLGTRGSGKTYSCLQYCIMNDDFTDRYFLISPTAKNDPKVLPIFENFKQKKQVHFYDELNVPILEEIVNLIKDDIEKFNEMREFINIYNKLKKNNWDEKCLTKNDFEKIAFYDIDLFLQMVENMDEIFFKKHPPVNTIIIDDCFGSRLLQNERIGRGENPLIKLMIYHRHIYTNVILSLQSISNVPYSIRRNTTRWIMFPQADTSIYEKYIYVCLGNIFKNKNQFINLLEECAKEPHQFLFIDISNLQNPDIRIGFNKKLIEF